MENNTFFNLLVGDHFADREFKISFNNTIKTKVFPNHHKLLKVGDIPKHIWIINEGFAMSYIMKEGKKVPLLFWDKDRIIISPKGILKQQASEFTIELLEKSNLSFMHYDDFHSLMQSYPKMSLYVQNKQEEMNYILEKRVVDLLSSSAEERYKKLMTEFPSVTLKVPVELIASYLGVSRKTLNRIRAKGLRKNVDKV